MSKDNRKLGREYQGLLIAATVRLRQDGVLWRVPSQKTDRVYTVNHRQGTCSCTDYGTRKVKCKHLWAVEPDSLLPTLAGHQHKGDTMKLWYVCEALARQKLGLGDDYTLFAADIGYVKGQRQQGNWTHVKVGIGKRLNGLEKATWADERRGIIIYRREIETYPGYEP